MAKSVVPVELKKAIRSARSLIESVAKADGNEAETRRRVERIFENVMGFDIAHLSREHAVKGAGATEHVDFAIRVKHDPEATPVIMVELKRVGIELNSKHLKQVCTYAINAGCEWVLLTNGKEWRIYHVEFSQPPITQLVDEWDLFEDEMHVLAEKFQAISLKSLRKGSLSELWKKTKVLSPESILSTVLSPESLKLYRRLIRKNSGVLVDFPDFVSSFKRLLNEAAVKELASINVKMPEKRSAKPKTKVVPSKQIINENMEIREAPLHQIQKLEEGKSSESSI